MPEKDQIADFGLHVRTPLCVTVGYKYHSGDGRCPCVDLNSRFVPIALYLNTWTNMDNGNMIQPVHSVVTWYSLSIQLRHDTACPFSCGMIQPVHSVVTWYSLSIQLWHDTSLSIQFFRGWVVYPIQDSMPSKSYGPWELISKSGLGQILKWA